VEEIMQMAREEGINNDDRYLRLIIKAFAWYEQERMSRPENLATKDDIRETKQEIKDDIKMLIHMMDKRFEDMQNSIKRLQWLIGAGIGFLTLLMTALALILHR